MIFSIFLGLIIIILVLEIGLRLTIGFHNPLLYIADPEIGYLLAPNQQVRRFRNRVVVNKYSMRSPSLLEPKQGLRVLLLGDSVLNGSWWTDQKDTISEMIKNNLTLDQYPSNLLEKMALNSPSFLRGARGDQPVLNFQNQTYSNLCSDEWKENPLNLPCKGRLEDQDCSLVDCNLLYENQAYEKTIEILNASANGWSPRNLLAYLQKFGCFQGDILVLLLNTDDLFGTAPTSIPVGLDRYYPSHKPALAILEAATRLLIPYTPPPEMAVVNTEGGDRVGFNLTALEVIYQIAQTEKSSLIITLTPLWHEVSSQPKAYEILARERLGKFIQDRNIPYLDFLPIFQNHPDPKTLYRDQIHLNPLGNQLVSTEISKLLVGETRHANLEDKF